MPVEQVVLVLRGGDTRQALLLGNGKIFLDAPGRFVRKADSADLAGLYQFAHRLQDLGDIGNRLFAILVEGVIAPVLAEMEMAAVWPVDLIEVDVIGLQPLQAGINSCIDIGGIRTLSAAQIFAARAGDLGGEHDILALAGLLEPGSDIFLRAALSFRSHRRRRIHFRGVEEIDALMNGVVHLLMGFGFAVLRAPGHCAQANLRNGNIGAA